MTVSKARQDDLFHEVKADGAHSSVKTSSRVQKFGEVFTSAKHVDQMLDMVESNAWGDPSIAFIEPTCGDGAFIIGMLSRRVKALLPQATKSSAAAIRNAIALSLGSIWGVDIQPDNVEEARANTWRWVIRHIETEGYDPFNSQWSKFLSWCAACVAHHIHQGNGLEISPASWTPFPLLAQSVQEARAEPWARSVESALAGHMPHEPTFINQVIVPR